MLNASLTESEKIWVNATLDIEFDGHILKLGPSICILCAQACIRTCTRTHTVHVDVTHDQYTCTSRLSQSKAIRAGAL